MLSSTEDRPSSYMQRSTIQQAANRMAESLLENARKQPGEEEFLNKEDHYGIQRLRCESYHLAGGGPGADLVIIFGTDGEVVDGYLSYVEPSGKAAVSLHPYEAKDLYLALRRPAT